MNKFLQISKGYQEDHDDAIWIAFKCLGCYNTFNLTDGDNWLFCPKCGSAIQKEYQEIKQKQWRRWGGQTELIDGKLEQTFPPEFDLVVEVKTMFDDEWEKDAFMSNYGSHRRIKDYMRFKNTYNQRRFHITPSKVSPLP